MDEKEKISPAAIAALEQGNLIEAIKIIREMNKIGLKEAKDLADSYVEQTPQLKERIMDMQRVALGRFKRWVVSLAIAILAIVIYLYFGKK